MDKKDAMIDAKTVPAYERRHIVARVGMRGHCVVMGVKRVIHDYLTFKPDRGPAYCARFVKPAPVDKNGFMRLEALKEGDIVVEPGFVYRKESFMPSSVMVAHLKAMKTWRKPHDVIVPWVDKDEAPVDLGTVFISRRK